MRIFYLYAHPRHDSFNGALFETARKTLSQQHSVFYLDLYQEKFKAVADWDDFNDNSLLNVSQYNLAQKVAWEHEQLKDDITHSLHQVMESDYLILQFPLWWFGMPAILKGWFDRVFVKGLAYDAGKWFETGGFYPRKVSLAITTQAPETAFTEQGLNGSINSVLHPIYHALRFVGFTVIKPFVAYGVLNRTNNERQCMINEYQHYLATLDKQPFLSFNHIDDFDDDLTLKQNIQPKRASL